jgi:hypothetical protein
MTYDRKVKDKENQSGLDPRPPNIQCQFPKHHQKILEPITSGHNNMFGSKVLAPSKADSHKRQIR